VLAVIAEGATAVPEQAAPAIMAASSGAIRPAVPSRRQRCRQARCRQARRAAAKLSPAAKRVVEETRSTEDRSGSGRDGARLGSRTWWNFLSAKDTAPPPAANGAGGAYSSARGARAEQRVPMIAYARGIASAWSRPKPLRPC